MVEGGGIVVEDKVVVGADIVVEDYSVVVDNVVEVGRKVEGGVAVLE